MVKPYLIRGMGAPVQVTGRAAYRQQNRGMSAVLAPVPPPVGGWNARDALDQMKPEDAVSMNNWFPRTSDCITRPGYALHCNTGEGAHDVQFLQALTHQAVNKLLAGCNGKLIDVSTSTPSSVGTGFASNLWSAVQFKGKLFLANGTDAPQDWDGTSLVATAWTGTGLTKANLIQPFVFKNRLFFVEKDKPVFWYADAAGNITGSLVQFEVAANLSQGGNIKFITKVSRDGGAGPDDLFVIAMTTGFVIIYQGTDPGDSTLWSHVGTFYVGQPVSARGFIEIGSDVLLITKNGYVALTEVLPFGRARPSPKSTSDKIVQAASDAVQRYGTLFPWDMNIHSEGNMLIINVPKSATTIDQHVMNLATKSWTRFSGIPSYCWVTYGEQPYFGGVGDGKVYAFDQGNMSDAGSPITCDTQTAFNYLGDRQSYKKFQMARTIFSGPSLPAVQINSGADFKSIPVGGSLTTPRGDLGSAWDTSEWDTASWGGADTTYSSWQTLLASGYCVSLRVTLSIAGSQLKWQSTTFSYSRGGML